MTIPLTRRYSLLDRLFLSADQALRTLTSNVQTTGAPYPARDILETSLSASQSRQAAALMRINHAGEVCAQALYHGQALVTKNAVVAQNMHHAALEEGDHLAWCDRRLQELGSHASYLNPFWYAGSFCIGMLAGMVGDSVSLGFIVETEQQVIKHLEGHLRLLPSADEKSYKILQQMEADETKHRDTAIAAGAKLLPAPVKAAMSFTSKLMVKTAYWI